MTCVASEAPPVLRLVDGDGPRLFGLTTAERLIRQFARVGISVGDRDGPTILVRADAVLDAPLIPVLIERPNLLLTAEDGTPLAAHISLPLAGRVGVGEVPQKESHDLEAILAARPPPQPSPQGGGGSSVPAEDSLLQFLKRSPSQLDAAYWKALRKRETPYAMVATAAERTAIEWRMFMGTYKGATDLVTKHLWPVPAFHATRWLAAHGVKPNPVTLVAAALTVLAFWLFLEGAYLPGLLAAWAMTFLDTVDGKLARTTLTASKWGDVLDHGIDLVHPPFWYAAWAIGLGIVGQAFDARMFWTVLAVTIGGYVLQRIMEGIAIAWLGLEIHIWRPIDTAFRQITARRNPNLILLTAGALAGRPGVGLIAVAAWTAICLVLHALQLAQALMARRRAPLVSWLAHRP